MKKLIYLIKRFRVLLLNFFIRISGNTIAKVLGLITVPIIARALQPEAYGQWSLVNVVVGYTLIFVEFGYIPLGIRRIAGGEKSEEDVVSEILSTRLFFAIFSVIVSALVLTIIFYQQASYLYILFIGLALVFTRALNIDFYFFGKKNMLVPTIAQLSGQGLYILGIITLVKKPNDLIWVVISYIIFQMTYVSITITNYCRKEKLKIRLSLSTARKTLAASYKLGISAKVEMLQNSLPSLIIPVIIGTYALGIFAAGTKIFGITILFYQAIMLSLAPYLTKIRHYPQEKAFKYIVTLLAIAIAGGCLTGISLYFGGEYLLNILFGKSFGGSLAAFKLISLLLIPIQPVYMLLGSILVFNKYENYFLKINIVSLIITGVCTPILIYFFQLTGAVVGMFLPLFSSVIMAIYYIRKIWR